MPVLVVDELEVVDVDEEQGAADVLGLRLGEDLRGADVEIFAVGDAGQRIRPGGVLHEVEGLLGMVVQPLDVRRKAADLAGLVHFGQYAAAAGHHVGELPVEAGDGIGDVAAHEQQHEGDGAQAERDGAERQQALQRPQPVFQEGRVGRQPGEERGAERCGCRKRALRQELVLPDLDRSAIFLLQRPLHVEEGFRPHGGLHEDRVALGAGDRAVEGQRVDEFRMHDQRLHAGRVEIGPGGKARAVDHLAGMGELLGRDLRERVFAVLVVVVDRQRRADDRDRDEFLAVVGERGDALLQPHAERGAAVAGIGLVDEQANGVAGDERIDEAAVLRHLVLEEGGEQAHLLPEAGALQPEDRGALHEIDEGGCEHVASQHDGEDEGKGAFTERH